MAPRKAAVSAGSSTNLLLAVSSMQVSLVRLQQADSEGNQFLTNGPGPTAGYSRGPEAQTIVV